MNEVHYVNLSKFFKTKEIGDKMKKKSTEKEKYQPSYTTDILVPNKRKNKIMINK